MYRQILRGKFDFPSPEWDHVSNDAKDFISKLLIVDPEKRYTAKQVRFAVLKVSCRLQCFPGCDMSHKLRCIWMERSACWSTSIFVVVVTLRVCWTELFSSHRIVFIDEMIDKPSNSITSPPKSSSTYVAINEACMFLLSVS